eukprot:CAMPEP_0171062850 /NCGR_PEP_ID=MMETSP0766_2-20121228/5283_1 /TAXON_ID=439317 /ORGANISM="Gambierdiscus australes, Strain CAWD 149" /LENGTH=87 /DNA_ID=CAMNT_0011518665 /DNA_START=421 /DNA_END=684 /DNA_ORIENTATION=-
MPEAVGNHLLQGGLQIQCRAKPTCEEHVVDEVLSAAKIRTTEGCEGKVSLQVYCWFALNGFLRHEIGGAAFDPTCRKRHGERPRSRY